MGYVAKQKGRLVKWGKKRYIPKGKIDAGTISTLAKDIWYLKGLVNSEKRYFDNSGGPSTIDYTGVSYNLTAMAQGDTEQTRTGTSIFVRSLYVQATIDMNTTELNTGFRMIVFIDKNANPSSLPTDASHLLEFTGSNKAFVSPLKFPEARNRFQILCDKRVTMSNSGQSQKSLKVYKKLRHHTKYVGSASTDEGKGQIYLLFVSDQGVNLPAVTWTSRVMYHDN